MSGGKSQKKQYQPQPQMQPVPQTQLQTSGYGGMGYTQVPQTFTGASKPGWMTGYFDAPWWGKDAVTGEDLTQADLQPQAPPAPEPAPEPAPAPVRAVSAQAFDPDLYYRMSQLQQQWDQDRAMGSGQNIFQNGSGAGMGFGRTPMDMYKEKMARQARIAALGMSPSAPERSPFDAQALMARIQAMRGGQQ